ncbi:MAG: 2-dehydro-3-deoxyphosphooctonate aldolase (KDO 8-P synthase) [Verrucomicrobiales bacterium]|jgi:2-dehydro-3-deoxyphosphooctonate aldolase (KDO 8-P synthase)
MAIIGNFLQQGPRTEPFFILGPCVMESETFTWEMARAVQEIGIATGANVVFKASYDKANRSASSSFRGPGPEAGSALLKAIRTELNLPVTTDVHTAEEAKILGESVDILQIPAFLCRQTDLIQAAAETGKIVNVKKGQFLAPWDMKNIAHKLEAFGAQHFYFTERGVSFGYNNLVADMRALYWMREEGYQVIFDATHSVQRPGGQGETSGGDGVLAPVLARAAVAVGCDGVFMETHPDPTKALSDGPNQVPLSELQGVIERLLTIHRAAHG